MRLDASVERRKADPACSEISKNAVFLGKKKSMNELYFCLTRQKNEKFPHRDCTVLNVCRAVLHVSLLLFTPLRSHQTPPLVDSRVRTGHPRRTQETKS